jgi:hypothetical protein
LTGFDRSTFQGSPAQSSWVSKQELKMLIDEVPIHVRLADPWTMFVRTRESNKTTMATGKKLDFNHKDTI